MAFNSVSITLDDGRSFVFSASELSKVKDEEIIAALEAAGVAPSKQTKIKVEQTKEISN